MPNIRNAEQILEAITDHLPELPLPPVANAMIMPVNPQRWASYIGGSILTQNLESGSADLISRPFENLRLAQAYS